MVLGGDMAMTAPLARGQAWARELEQWVSRAERRDQSACATRAGESIGGPALQDAAARAGSESGIPVVGVTCATRRDLGGRTLPLFELAVSTPDGFMHAVAVSAAQLRALAATVRTGAAR